MMRLIDKDRCKADIEQFNRPLCDGYHMKDYVLYQIITDIENQPTVDAVPIEFIRSEIKNSKGFYNSSLRRLLDAWAERKEE